MKKIITLLAAAFIVQTNSYAQTVTGGDMETWKSYTSLAITMSKPDSWYTADSIVAALKQLAFKPYSARVVKSTSIKHGGTASALLESGGADSFPSILSNANIKIDAAAIAAISTGDFTKFKYLGGTAVSKRIEFVHAYTMFKAATTGTDSASMTVFAFKNGIAAGGLDSTVGYGIAHIKDGTSFSKQEVHIDYVDATIVPDRIVIVFISSASIPPKSGSKLYVDDVSLSDPSGIELPMVNNSQIQVYPNPINDFINVKINSNDNFTFSLFNSLGQQLIHQEFTATLQVSTSALAAGNYIYLVQDNKGRSLSGGYLQK